MVRKKYPPLRPSSVNGLAVEQHVICTTFDGAVTEEMIGPVTPEEMVPVNAGTRSTSTRYLAASTPTVGWPWSSRRMNCTGQPLTPPPWLTCSIASSADSAIFLVIGAIEPVSGRIPPIFTGQLCAAALAADSTPASNPRTNTTALQLSRFMVSFLHRAFSRGSLIVHVARDNRRLADQPARAEEQYEHQEQADQDHLDGGALRGAAGRHQLGDDDTGAGPDGPDDQRAEQGAAVTAAAADDEHRPHLEGDDREEVERADEADEADVERAGEPHERRDQHEGFQAEATCALAERDGGGLVLADGLQHAAPGRPQDPVERPVGRRQDRDHEPEEPQIETERRLEQRGERLGDARETLRPAGELPVQGDELDRDGHAERGDGEVVAAQADRDQADEPARQRRRGHRGQHAHEPQQAEVADVRGLRRRGEDRVRVGADRVEAHHAGVE